MQQETVKVWDIVVRVFHWSLVLSFAIAYASGDALENVHVFAGYYIGVLLLVRVLWGFIGTHYARFAQFVKGPAVVMDYLRGLLQGDAKATVGHNPAGGWMIIAMLITLSLTALSGLAIYGMDEAAGPLAMLASAPGWMEDVVEELHEFLANGMLLLVALHLLGVIVSSGLHGENLVKAMWTGKKRRAVDDKNAAVNVDPAYHSQS